MVYIHFTLPDLTGYVVVVASMEKKTIEREEKDCSLYKKEVEMHS